MYETIEKTFNVSSPTQLNVSNICGSVEIYPGEEGVIQVSATKQPHTGDEKSTHIEITQDADGTVRVLTRFPEASWNWLFGSHPCEVDYVVKAPRQCSLKLSGVSNTVRVEGFEGDFNINSVSGEIDLRDLNGSVRIHTVSGDASGGRISGALDLDTVSAEICMKDSSLASIQAISVSGDVRICTSLGDGPYDFKSVSGSVRLTLPFNSHYTGELHSVSGDLISASPVSSYSRHHGSQLIDVQGGGVIVSLNSVSGDLSLDGDGEIPSAAEPVTTVSTETRLAVLERIERGELSVDEALGQLNV